MKRMQITQGLIWSLMAGLSLAFAAEAVAPVIATQPKDVSPLAYDAGFMRLLVPSDGTEGRTAVLELYEMAGFETPWHQHKNMDETFYVLEGTLSLKIKNKTLELPAGSSIFIPRGTAHAQGSATRKPVKVLATFSPGGFDQFFLGRVELFKRAKPGSPEFAAGMRRLREQHAQWIQEPDSSDTHP